MHWKTAYRYLSSTDCALTHLYTGTTLSIPPWWTTVSLVTHKRKDQGEVALPAPPFAEIEAMIQKAGVALTGWVPGDHWIPGYSSVRWAPGEDWNRYHQSDLYRTIFTTVRRLTHDQGHAEIAVSEIRDRCEMDPMLFCFHHLNLIEDQQGLVASDERYSRVRLATWREAMQASSAFIEEGVHPPVTRPQIILCLEARREDWTITAQGDGSFRVSQAKSRSSVCLPQEAGVDRWLEEQDLPLGWAATYGEVCETEQSEWF